ncbi:MAG: PAS domain S-box protein [Bacteroidota bacterium]
MTNSDESFKLIIQNISDIVTLIDRHGKFIYNNKALTRILGYEPEELNGRSIFELVHPDDLEKMLHRFNELLSKDGIGTPIEYHFRNKSGGYLLMESIGNIQLNNPGFLAIILISRDITEKRKVDDAIKASEEKLRSLVQNISDIITIVSIDGDIIYQSASARQLMGYEENELKKRNFSDLVHPEDLPHLMQSFQKLIVTGGVSELIEFRLLNNDGNYFYIEAQATNQLDNPNIKGLVVNSRDISIRKKTEEERQLLIKELTKNNADLRQFSYIVSHNLRAPLTNLLSTLNLLDYNTVSTERSLKLMEGFKSTTFRLNDTLNDLINILLVKNNTNIQKHNLSFEASLSKVSKSVNSLIAETQTQIITDFTAANYVQFNEPYLESIFLNLITNSIRYKSNERAPKISITTERQNDETILIYRDNGIGFNMELVKDKIFGLHQKFHHHPESRGIGLYLIHAQITSLEGRISVDSQINKGTIFTIAFKN